jgi:hypothetical protein
MMVLGMGHHWADLGQDVLVDRIEAISIYGTSTVESMFFNRFLGVNLVCLSKLENRLKPTHYVLKRQLTEV